MKVFKASMFIVGAIIGGGFASGKEIFEYFAKYGAVALLYVVPLFVLFYMFIKTYLKIGCKIENFNLRSVNKMIYSKNSFSKSKANPYDIIFLITFFISASAMFAGLVGLIKSYLQNLNTFVCYILVFGVSLILYKTSLKKFEMLSNLVVPLIIVCIVITSVLSIKGGNFAFNISNANAINLPFKTLTYVGQNTFFACFVIAKLGKNLSPKEQKQTSFLTALILSLLLILGILIFLFNPKLANFDLPFAIISGNLNLIFNIIFAFVILFSIITTYATILTSLKSFNFNNKKHNNPFIMLGIIAFLSLFNFGKIIKYLYPIIGVFGIIYFIKINKKFKNY